MGMSIFDAHANRRWTRKLSVYGSLGNRVLETLPQYSIFGEMALIDANPRSATAVAASDVKLVPVNEKQFLFLISNTPHFALNVMRIMARRLRAMNKSL